MLLAGDEMGRTQGGNNMYELHIGMMALMIATARITPVSTQ